jgi:competence protein ComEA
VREVVDDEAVIRRRLRRVVGAPLAAAEEPAAAPEVTPATAQAQPPVVEWDVAEPFLTDAADPSLGSAQQASLSPDSHVVDGPPGRLGALGGRGAFDLGGRGIFDPGRRGVKALAAVAAVVVLVAAFLAWRARPHAEPVGSGPPAATAAAPGGSPADAAPARSAAPGGTAQPAGGASEAVVVVAVAGKVRQPGLVRLSPGARVADAIAAAGGVLPGTDMALLNLARKVTDGELIVVGIPVPAGAEGGGPAGNGAPGGAGQSGAPGGKVSLNTATLAQLDTLPGVGTVLAQRILEYREGHGGFRSVAELRQVEGIGEARYEQLKELVTL